MTALALHADSQHLFGNMLFGAPFLILVCRRAGSPRPLPDAAGRGARRVCNALYRPYGHVSLGFSTALSGRRFGHPVRPYGLAGMG
ncbi:MAG: hypothetical protein V8Q84_11555 [Bilophila sp.]